MARKLVSLLAAVTLLGGLSAPAFAAKPHKGKTTTHATKPAKKSTGKSKKKK